MSLEGKIKDFGMTDIFQLIGMQRKTGFLTLTSEQDTVTVTFEDGMVVASESYHKGKSGLLGQILVQAELMTEKDLEHILSIQKETGQKIGRILIQEKMVRPKDLSSIIQLQVRETVFRIFEWKEGNYKFEQIPVTYDKTNMVPIPCDKILMETMRILDEWPLVRKTVSSMNLVYRKTDKKRNTRTPADDLDSMIDTMFDDGQKDKSFKEKGKALQKDFPLIHEEEKIYNLVDGERTVRKLIDIGLIGEFETCKALFNLVSAGLIQPVGEEAQVPAEEAIGRKSGRAKKILRNLAAYAIMVLLVSSLFVVSRRPGTGVLFNVARSMTYRFEMFKQVHALQEMNRIVLASHVYFLETGSFPVSLDDLVQKILLEENEERDPWGSPYSFEVRERMVILSSAGRDRQEGTDDDLVKETLF
ncbi:MAG: DUF4388 domain-containing protein [bacterium]